jgi:site-specific DNA recombinase
VCERKVTMFPSTINGRGKKREKKEILNVAAYCRVSTSQEEQENSYESQVAYYTKLITETPEWNLVAIYADDGISGTDMKKRDNFNLMMERCLRKEKDIDLILTKSISRFARNTVDCLSCIRRLKERNIAIYFEKEHINTLEATGELLITILSSQAQEESRNISENVKWGLKRKYENGEVLIKRTFGYEKGVDNHLHVIPEEAEIVRIIYKKYLEGQSLNDIADLLTKMRVSTIRGNTRWNGSSIRVILTNVKYIGDAMAQKTFTVDYLLKDRRKNKGELPQYYVQNLHEPIISKELYYLVQQEMKRSASLKKKSMSGGVEESEGRYSGKFALSKILICGECGSEYRRQIRKKNGKAKAVWRCENRLRNGIRYCRHSPTLEEEMLHGILLKAINRMADQIQIGSREAEEIFEIQTEEIPNQAQKENLNVTVFESIYSNIADNLEDYEKMEIHIIEEQLGQDKVRNMVIQDVIGKRTYFLNEYNEQLVRKLMRKINVINAFQIEVVFKTGIVIVETWRK